MKQVFPQKRKLLKIIFGEKASEFKDVSLRLPHDIEGNGHRCKNTYEKRNGEGWKNYFTRQNNTRKDK